MKKLSLLIAIMLALTCARAENLIVNGDFSEGEKGWGGSAVKTKKMDKNECLKIRPDDDELRIVQLIPLTEKFQSYSVSFKYKTRDDYSGKGVRVTARPLTLDFKIPDDLSEVGISFDLKATSEWTSVNGKISFNAPLTACSKIEFFIRVKPGNGVIYFDDFELVGVP